MRPVLAEGIGTFFLVFVGAGSAAVDAWSGGGVSAVGIALAFALVVLAMVYALGPISGAHINPAVTVAFWITRRFPGGRVGPYILAQCAGATAAALLLVWLLGDATAAATLPRLDVTRAFAVEVALSFVLMFVIMAVVTDHRVERFAAGGAIGLTVGFCALAGGPLTGASMNPARSLGPALASGAWEAHALYWAAPILGAALGGWCYGALLGSGPEEQH